VVLSETPIYLDSQCPTNQGEINISGIGLLHGRAGRLLLHNVRISPGASVSAPGLTVAMSLSLYGHAQLNPGANQVDSILITNSTTLLFVVQDKSFPLIKLGAVGLNWSVIPAEFRIVFEPGQSWNEDELRGFDYPLIRGTKISNCAQWIENVSIEGENSDQFGLDCADELDAWGEEQTVMHIRGVLPFWTLATIIGMACGGLALLIVAVVVIGVCCCKSPPPKRVDDAAEARKARAERAARRKEKMKAIKAEEKEKKKEEKQKRKEERRKKREAKRERKRKREEEKKAKEEADKRNAPVVTDQPREGPEGVEHNETRSDDEVNLDL
jgi:hypothetical protein